jgi:hypothetical protein
MIRFKKICSVVDPNQDPHNFGRLDLDTGGQKDPQKRRKKN